MPTVASHTLGCKVNQYDTQAMMELLSEAGYRIVSWGEPADVYLINTCTVTGTGDRKSVKLARKIRREHPDSKLVLCGCMAQAQASLLMSLGADLVIGTQRRHEIADLLRQVTETGRPVCAVEPMQADMPFESLQVSSQLEHTRAVMKIQEGCANHCTYCIIPAVRGPIRSRLPAEIRSEACRLRDAGYKEIVLTGIHLASYGRDFRTGETLLDAIRLIQETEGILRIRLGSLEPMIATPSFAEDLSRMDKICPQFHLALQSGSDSVLRRMKRRYNTKQYLTAVDNLRKRFPSAAFTTDILTGFPGETEEEFAETCRMIEKVGFARIHVFPYSPRPDTPAAMMENQLPAALKEDRARQLIALGESVAAAYLQQWFGRTSVILPEEKVRGCWEGYTPEYIRVRLPKEADCVSGEPLRVTLTSVHSRMMCGEIIQEK